MFLNQHIIYTVFATTLALGGCGAPNLMDGNASQPREAWNAPNDPLQLRGQYEVMLTTLPTTGELDVKPWTDSYWPNYRGGIADRWNSDNRDDPFSYALHDQATLQTMSVETMAQLSPAEKYDIFIGNFTYPLVAYERERTNSSDPTWFGLCHGWAPAAINFKEPKPVTLTSAAGIAVPFGSSDVKALLTLVQQGGQGTRFLGERCNANLATDPDRADDDECRDVNPGSFHIVVANEIGLLKTGFVAEVSRDYQVWNQPVFGFSSEVLSRSEDVYATAAPGTRSIATVRTTLLYTAEIGARWEAQPIDVYPHQTGTRVYNYTLELDEGGNIIGGEWLDAARPDFMWTQRAAEFRGYFAAVETIYKAATAEAPH